MTSMAWPAWIERLRARSARAGQRRLLVISGERAWCEARAGQIPGVDRALWLTAETRPGRHCLTPSKARTWLGLETELLICDLFSAGFDPLAVAALAGTVRAGGLIVLLAPPLPDWPRWPDPVARRLAVHGRAPAADSRYLRRLADRLADDPRVLMLTPGQPLPDGQVDEAGKPPLPAESDDQRQVIDAVLQLAESAAPAALVVTAARGRGKSAALGMAMADWLRRAAGELWLTAPRLRNSEVIFTHLRRRLPAATVARDRVTLGRGVVRFLAPDALLRQAGSPSLLIVDEAAAMPTAMLERMLARCERVVFSTTEQGYEGSARGFALRFRRRLDRLRPGWRRIEMRTPLRWADGDRVEGVLDELLLLDPALPPVPATVDPDRLEIVRLDRDRLVDDESLLRAVFGLLAGAHYQTTPMDLRHLLDGGNIELWAALAAGRPVAASMVAREGGLDAALGREIFRGKRRPRGHLLPQLLAARGDDPAAVTLDCLRIVRIAVHPALQRRGIGSRLLAAIVEGGGAVEYLGASFAMDPAVLAFWRRAGFVPLHLGVRANPSSGVHAVAVGLGRGAAGKRLIAGQRRFFVDNFLCQLGDVFSSLDADTVVALLAGAGGEGPLSAREQAQVEAVAWGERGYESTMLAVRKTLLRAFREAGGYAGLTEVERRLLVGRVLQNQGWEALTATTGCRGRRETIGRFRQALRKLLADAADDGINPCCGPLRESSS